MIDKVWLVYIKHSDPECTYENIQGIFSAEALAVAFAKEVVVKSHYEHVSVKCEPLLHTTTVRKS